MRNSTTRFIVLSREKKWAKPGNGKVITTFVFRVRNVPAALYKALGGFATNGVNMTKLESYMVGGNFFATQFYADVEGHPDDRALVFALEELAFFSKELTSRRLSGAPFRDTFKEGLAGRYFCGAASSVRQLCRVALGLERAIFCAAIASHRVRAPASRPVQKLDVALQATVRRSMVFSAVQTRAAHILRGRGPHKRNGGGVSWRHIESRLAGGQLPYNIAGRRMNAEGRTVTGAARGIGLATAKRFLAEGWRVALLDIDGDNLQAHLRGARQARRDAWR